jgi:4-carboxymuconolactone decarboxylase
MAKGTMTRLADPHPDEMEPAARAAYDRLVSSRQPADAPADHVHVYPAGAPGGGGPIGGPFNAWLRNPQLADHVVGLGSALRYRTSLAPRLVELAILTVARAWRAEYAWASHEAMARRAGLGDEVFEAIAAGRRPPLAEADAAAVYDVCMALHKTKAVDEATYARAAECLGEAGVVELVCLVGYYVMVCMTLATFEVAPAPGAKPPVFA